MASSVNQFDTATAVAADGSCAIEPGWDIGGNANGGYLLALLARHVLAVAQREDPITITGHFLAPGTAGPVTAAATVLKRGRLFTTASGSLLRDDRLLLHAVAACGEIDAFQGPTFVDAAPPKLPPIEECVRRPAGNGFVPVPLMDRLDVRLHPDSAGFASGPKSGVAEVAGWFAFADGRPIDPLALLLVCDAFPPAVFNLELPGGWVPTVEYTVHVRGRPAPGPLRCVFRSQFVQGGMLNEDGEVWDSAGHLVATSRQLGLLARG